MKRLLTILAAALLCISAGAQKTHEQYRNDYLRQIQAVGYSGLGVDYIISEWEKACPDSMEVRRARFNYWLDKGLVTNLEIHPGKTYLGMEPALQLKDSLDRPVNYFQVNYYEDRAFSKAMECADMSVARFPWELRYRLDIIGALLVYEHGSPDMAASEMNKLLDVCTDVGKWTLDGVPLTEEVFDMNIQELCFRLFDLGTPAGYEAFRAISERMSSREPRSADWLANIGAYWQKARQNYKKAEKYYRKALKIDPDNFAAARNLGIIERIQNTNKKKK